MDYNKLFEDRIDQLHMEGRYRVFADIKRRCGAYPQADHFSQGVQSAAEQIRPVTVWCSNDYLGMSQNPVVRAAMHEAIDAAGAGSGGTRNIRLTPTPLHTDEHMDWLVTALAALWAECPVGQGKYVKLAAQ